MPFKLLALIFPLSLDTLAVSAALGMAGLTRRERLRLSVIFALFEAGMPIIGVVAGGFLTDFIGEAADFVAIAVLALVGIWMMREDEDELPEDLANRAHGVAVLGLGLSISLDELAIGFTIGLLGMPVVLVLILIAAQAFLATQIGTRFGRQLGRIRIFGEELNEQAERAAGIVLIGLAAVLLALRLSGRST